MGEHRVEQRAKGEPFAKRRYGWIPADALEGDDYLRVVLTFRTLLLEDELPKCGPDFEAVWATIDPASDRQISETTRDAGATFIHEYFKVDNPSLLPLLLQGFLHQWTMSDSAAAAAFRSTSLARNPTPLGRPNTRTGGRNYAEDQRQRRQRGDRRMDMASIKKSAEAWVMVNHHLVLSLMAMVATKTPRKYNKKNPTSWANTEDDADIRDRHDTWAKDLRRFDKPSIEGSGLTSPTSSNGTLNTQMTPFYSLAILLLSWIQSA